MTERRVIALVDGFNLYHAVDEVDCDPHTHLPRHKKQHLKWLDLAGLAKAFIHQSIRIREHHLEKNLLPADMKDGKDNLIFVRPKKYGPPGP